MKHDIYITLVLITLFLGSHVIGLFIIKNYLLKEEELPLGIQKPEFKEETSYIPIIISLLVATAVALLLIRLKALRIWKTWFFLSVFIALLIAFAAFFPELVALVLAVVFAVLKTFRPTILIHNFTELFIYGGLASIFVPIFSLLSIIILLVLISVYDMIAVWKTKHMISMAKFQAKSRIFAGLFVPYKAKLSSKLETQKIEKQKKPVYREAILGGGDIAFPLMFSGVMLKNFGFLAALIVSVITAVALLMLFLFADKRKFYPAMPFLTIGCLIGYLVVYLLF